MRRQPRQPEAGYARLIVFSSELGAWLSGRASPSHGGGRWFDSSSAHQFQPSRSTIHADWLSPTPWTGGQRRHLQRVRLGGRPWAHGPPLDGRSSAHFTAKNRDPGAVLEEGESEGAAVGTDRLRAWERHASTYCMSHTVLKSPLIDPLQTLADERDTGLVTMCIDYRINWWLSAACRATVSGRRRRRRGPWDRSAAWDARAGVPLGPARRCPGRAR